MWRGLRLVLMIAALALTGCLDSRTPAITPDTAENVGNSLTFVDREGVTPGTTYILTRLPDGSYELSLIRPAKEGSSSGKPEVLPARALVRRLGATARGQALLIQVQDMPQTPEMASAYPYSFYPVVLWPKGDFASLPLNCLKDELAPLAERVGVTLGCSSDFLFTRIESAPSPEVLWHFLFDAFGNGKRICQEDQPC